MLLVKSNILVAVYYVSPLSNRNVPLICIRRGKKMNFGRLTLPTLAILGLTLYAAYGTEQLPHYNLSVVAGFPLTATCLRPQVINNKGDVLIWATDAERHISFLWSSSKVTELGTLGGKLKQKKLESDMWIIPGTIGYGLNDKCQVVGVSQIPDGNMHAFLWERGKMQDLGTLGGTSSDAWDINNLGQVVGSADTIDGATHAFIWDAKNGMRDLGIPGKNSRAIRINHKGQVIGQVGPNQETFIWENGKISYPEKYPTNGFNAFQGLDINDRGDIVGTVNRGGTENFESRIFLWSSGKMIPVETAAKKCNAFGLTPDGLVVGNAFDTPTGQHAFVWRAGQYSLINDLLTKSGWDVYFTIAVNSQGWIAAVAKQVGKNNSEVVLLEPEKEVLTKN